MLLAVPALGMKTNNANLDTLPRSIPQVQTMHAIAAAFPAQGTTATVVVHGPADEQAALPRRPAAPRDDRRRPRRGFAPAGAGAIETSTDGQTQRLTLPIQWSWSDQRATQAVQHAPRPAGAGRPRRPRAVEHAVGGDVAESLDYAHARVEPAAAT